MLGQAENRKRLARARSGGGAKMRIWAVVMCKGGVGRTVLTVSLACQAAKQGLKTLAINLNAQPPLHAWFKTRLASTIPNDHLQVIGAKAGELPFLLNEARHQGIKLVLIDTVPCARGEIIDVCRLSELILMPVKPAAWDLLALHETAEILSSSRTSTYGAAAIGALEKAIVVLNCAGGRTREAEEALKALDGSGVKYICKTRIGERIEVRKAAEIGQGVCEFAPHGKAAAEFAALFHEIVQWHSLTAKPWPSANVIDGGLNRKCA
jgi:chromosome partitioning protein